jgi:hypothetical protein
MGVTSNWLFFFAVLGLQALVISNIAYQEEKKVKKSVNKI